jgi:hypothetical protein
MILMDDNITEMMRYIFDLSIKNGIKNIESEKELNNFVLQHTEKMRLRWVCSIEKVTINRKFLKMRIYL